MSFESTVITVLISSPSDVSADRKIILDEMQAWNQRNASTKKCFLTALTWEDLVAPDMGDSGQEVVNIAIGDGYDVFLGLMWGRFGTATTQAESGTQEEFERALRRKKSGDALRISFFFRNSEISIDDIDPEQLAKVRKFKSDLSSQGAFYGQYANDRELASGLVTLFDRIANEKERYVKPERADESGTQPGDQPSGENNSLTEMTQSDDGLFDLEDSLAKESDELAACLVDWGNRFSEMSIQVQAVTEKLNELLQFAKPDRVEMRRHIDIVTSTLVEFAQFANEKIASVEDHLENFYVIISSLFEILHDFEGGEINRNDIAKQVVGLLQEVKIAELSTVKYISVMSDLPRIDKNFNKARDAVVIVHKRLGKKLRDFSKRLDHLTDLS